MACYCDDVSQLLMLAEVTKSVTVWFARWSMDQNFLGYLRQNRFQTAKETDIYSTHTAHPQGRWMLTFSMWLSYRLAFISFNAKQIAECVHYRNTGQDVTCWLFSFDSISMYLVTSLMNGKWEFSCRAIALQSNTGPRRHCPHLFSLGFFQFPRFLVQASVVLHFRTRGILSTFTVLFAVKRFGEI